MQVLLCRSRVSAGHEGEGRGEEKQRSEEGKDGRKGKKKEKERKQEGGKAWVEGEGEVGTRVRQTAAFLIRVTFGNESQDLSQLIYGRCYNAGKHARRVSAQMVRLSEGGVRGRNSGGCQVAGQPGSQRVGVMRHVNYTGFGACFSSRDNI